MITTGVGRVIFSLKFCSHYVAAVANADCKPVFITTQAVSRSNRMNRKKESYYIIRFSMLLILVPDNLSNINILYFYECVVY